MGGHTYESYKLGEADFFYERLRRVEDSPRIYSYYLSAFLSASRSVLQYAHAEACDLPGGLAWYEAEMANSPLLKYLRDKRDVNIHAGPVIPFVTIATSDSGSFAEASLLEESQSDGSLSSKHTPSEGPSTPQVTRAMFTHVFGDWPGNETVTELCARYLDELYALAARGTEKGFITW